MPASLFLFQEGLFLSAIDLGGQRYVTLREDYSVELEFLSLDLWYLHTMRDAYADRYGLPNNF